MDIKNVKLSDIKPSPFWETLRSKEDEKLKTKRNDKCFCGSRKKYKKCCLISPPLQKLINLGHTLLTDNEGRVVVGVKHSHSTMEGFQPTDIETHPFEETYYFDINEVSDYSSLYELTNSGWYEFDDDDFNDEHFPFLNTKNPFINVDGEWFRWDNSVKVRPLCMTMNWDKKTNDFWKSLMLIKHRIDTKGGLN